MSGNREATLRYVLPFGTFVGIMALERALNIPLGIAYPIRAGVTLAVLLIFSRGTVSLRARAPVASVAIGAAVFLVWIGPDVLFGPAYRGFWLFSNAVTGKAASSVAPTLTGSAAFLAVRMAGMVLLVPIVEELFWRGWLMRFLIDADFQKVPLGAYARGAFWMTALLFAAEHGPYWEVGLAAGLVYNWWMVRTRSLADCILAHAVTNALLGAYVIGWQQWQYWL